MNLVTRLQKAAHLPLPLLILAGCAQGGNLPSPNGPETANYHLGVGDQVRILTYEDAQLNNNFTVGADGTISFPMVGPTNAAGSTTTQLASTIATSLEKARLFTHPNVSVQIIKYRPISILGEVNHPGQYEFQPGMTMLDAVALADGFTYRAVTDHAADWRSNGQTTGNATEYRIDPGSTLEPGDVVTIYERYF